MRVYTTINPESFSNIYLITDDNNKYGVIIDPGSFSENVYKLVKYTGVEIKKIIITHNGPDQTNGIHLIKKIYNVELYAYDEVICDYETISVRNNSVITENDLSFTVLETPVFSYDSISIFIENALFTGDIFQAGALSSFIEKKEPTKYEFEIIKNKILSLPDHVILYPGRGPATTIEIERKFNPYFIKTV